MRNTMSTAGSLVVNYDGDDSRSDVILHFTSIFLSDGRITGRKSTLSFFGFIMPFSCFTFMKPKKSLN